MKKCCVIQPIGSKFEESYYEIIEPIITSCGFSPIRIEPDAYSPSGTIVEAKEKSITDCDLCVVEITGDDTFVWYLFGYATAIDKDIVVLCSDERGASFPFSVNNRRILTYSTNSMQSRGMFKKRLEAIIKEYGAVEVKHSLTELDIFVLKNINNQHNTPNEVVPRDKISMPDSDVTASLRRLTSEKYVEFVYSVDNENRQSGFYRCTEKAKPLVYSTTDAPNIIQSISV